MRPRRGAPIWLAGSTRFAGLSRTKARIALLLVALLLVACLTAVDTRGSRTGDPTAVSRVPDGQSDLLLYQTIVAGVRQDDPYYVVAAQAQRAAHYPLRPFFAMHLPTLAMVQAALPPLLVRILLLLLCIAAIVAWALRLRPAMTRLLPVGIAGGLLLIGLHANLAPALVMLHEIWAGPLIALSLALRRRGDWLAPVALGLCAMLIRETASLYVGIMAIVAWSEGERRESLAWLGSIAILGAALAAHAYAVSLVAGPLDATVQGWSARGLGFYVELVAQSSMPEMVPRWLAASLIVTSLFGWLAWRDPVAVRTVVMLAGYAATLALFVHDDDVHWVFVTTPLVLVGLVFAVDGLRDLIAAARDTRRITVTRIVR